MAPKSYFVHILSSLRGTLYTGVTNDLERRMVEHRSHLIPGFTSRYRVD
ncbi:MAG: GIY-YIG nuclease family protein [Anaerolineales bacterium]